MVRRRTKEQLVLSTLERYRLGVFARSRTLPTSLSQRAQIILCCVDGESNRSIAQRMRLSESTVARWLARFEACRIDGLYDASRPGRPPKEKADRVAHLVDATLHRQPPDGAVSWSVRSLAKATGIPKSTVQRYITLNLLGRGADS